MTQVKLKPIVSYVGGKRRFAKEIISKFPDSVLTNKKRKRY